MKALIIDHHEASAQILTGKLRERGYEVVYVSKKAGALDALSQNPFDVIFLDPSPQTSARQYVQDIRQRSMSYPYIFLTMEGADSQLALREAVNDVFPKPFSMESLLDKVSNAQRFLKLLEHMRHTSPDFPSAGGVISKSAFLQLFLSSLDRADRYEERSFVITIGISNCQDIRDLDGAYGADYVVAQLSQHLALNRRQSDIVGQTGESEFSLLLLRPLYETEPLDAAKRLTQSLAEADLSGEQVFGDIDIAIQLVDLPVGSSLMEHQISLKRSV